MDNEWFWRIMLTIALFLGFLLGLRQMTSDKPIRGYYLADNSGGILCIGVDIDNMQDDYIELNGHSLQEVIATIDSLNKTIRK